MYTLSDLLLAVTENNLPKVDKILSAQNNFNVHSCDGKEQNAILLAARYGHVELFKHLRKKYSATLTFKENISLNFLLYLCNTPKEIRKQILEIILNDDTCLHDLSLNGVRKAHILFALGRGIPDDQKDLLDNVSFEPAMYLYISGIEFNPSLIKYHIPLGPNQLMSEGDFLDVFRMLNPVQIDCWLNHFPLVVKELYTRNNWPLDIFLSNLCLNQQVVALEKFHRIVSPLKLNMIINFGRESCISLFEFLALTNNFDLIDKFYDPSIAYYFFYPGFHINKGSKYVNASLFFIRLLHQISNPSIVSNLLEKVLQDPQFKLDFLSSTDCLSYHNRNIHNASNMISGDNKDIFQPFDARSVWHKTFVQLLLEKKNESFNDIFLRIVVSNKFVNFAPNKSVASKESLNYGISNFWTIAETENNKSIHNGKSLVELMLNSVPKNDPVDLFVCPLNPKHNFYKKPVYALLAEKGEWTVLTKIIQAHPLQDKLDACYDYNKEAFYTLLAKNKQWVAFLELIKRKNKNNKINPNVKIGNTTLIQLLQDENQIEILEILGKAKKNQSSTNKIAKNLMDSLPKDKELPSTSQPPEPTPENLIDDLKSKYENKYSAFFEFIKKCAEKKWISEDTLREIIKATTNSISFKITHDKNQMLPLYRIIKGDGITIDSKLSTTISFQKISIGALNNILNNKKTAINALENRPEDDKPKNTEDKSKENIKENLEAKSLDKESQLSWIQRLTKVFGFIQEINISWNQDKKCFSIILPSPDAEMFLTLTVKKPDGKKTDLTKFTVSDDFFENEILSRTLDCLEEHQNNKHINVQHDSNKRNIEITVYATQPIDIGDIQEKIYSQFTSRKKKKPIESKTENSVTKVDKKLVEVTQEIKNSDPMLPLFDQIKLLLIKICNGFFDQNQQFQFLEQRFGNKQSSVLFHRIEGAPYLNKVPCLSVYQAIRDAINTIIPNSCSITEDVKNNQLRISFNPEHFAILQESQEWLVKVFTYHQKSFQIINVEDKKAENLLLKDQSSEDKSTKLKIAQPEVFKTLYNVMSKLTAIERQNVLLHIERIQGLDPINDVNDMHILNIHLKRLFRTMGQHSYFFYQLSNLLRHPPKILANYFSVLINVLQSFQNMIVTLDVGQKNSIDVFFKQAVVNNNAELQLKAQTGLNLLMEIINQFAEELFTHQLDALQKTPIDYYAEIDRIMADDTLSQDDKNDILLELYSDLGQNNYKYKTYYLKTGHTDFDKPYENFRDEILAAKTPEKSFMAARK